MIHRSLAKLMRPFNSIILKEDQIIHSFFIIIVLIALGLLTKKCSRILKGNTKTQQSEFSKDFADHFTRATYVFVMWT